MRKIVVDTNILIDYAHGYADWLGEILTVRQDIIELILPTIVIAEYYASQVLESEQEAAVTEKMFSLFLKQDLTEETAKVLGQILRRKSYPAGASLADLIIAATTVCLNAELATNNKTHFETIPYLRLFNLKSGV